MAVSVALYVFLSMQNRLRGGGLPRTTRHRQELACEGQQHSLHLDLNHCYLWSECECEVSHSVPPVGVLLIHLEMNQGCI